MTWWQKWLKYWRAEDMKKKPTKDMTIQELEDEYRKYHSELIMTGPLSQANSFRMSAIKDQLSSRGIYINDNGVEVYFLKD